MTTKHDIRLLTDNIMMENANLEKHEKKTYSDQYKLEVLRKYIDLGENAKATAREMSVAYATVQGWKATDWWKAAYADIKREEKLKLSRKVRQIADKALEQIDDRMEQGEVIYDQKTGKMKRKPLNARDLLSINNVLMERHLQLEKETEEREILMTNEEKLAALAERFARLAEKALDKPKPEVNVTDVVFVQESTEKSNA